MNAPVAAPPPAPLWMAWGHWLLPPDRFPRDAEGRHFRAVLLMTFALSSAALLLVMAVMEWWLDVPMLGAVLLAMSASLLGLSFGFRRSARARLCGNLVAGMIFGGSLLLVWLSGGRAAGVLIAGPIFVLFCTLALRPRDAAVWSAVAILIVLIAAWMNLSGAPAPYPPKPEWLRTAPFRVPVLMNLLAAAIGFLIVAAYRRMRIVLEHSQAALNRALRQSRRQEQRFEDFAQLAGDWFWETDADLRLSHVSLGFGEVFDLDAERMLGRTPMEIARLRFPDTVELDGIYRSLQQRRPFRDQRLIWRRLDGSYVAMLNHGMPVFDDDGEFLGYRGVVVDVSETYRLNRELRFSAETDTLTGLSNRRAFAARYAARRAEKYAHPAWLLYLDLDNFKQVNDCAGHDAGDRLLRGLAQALRDSVRQSDQVVRMGGDEFLLFLPEAERVQAETVAARVEVRVIALRGSEPAFAPIGASIGMVEVPDPAPPLDEMLKLADAACYAIKRERQRAAR